MQVFYSYSHRGERMRDKLEKQTSFCSEAERCHLGMADEQSIPLLVVHASQSITGILQRRLAQVC